MRRLMLALSLICCCSMIHLQSLPAALPDTPENRDRLGSYFALNGSKIFHIPNDIETTVSRRIDAMHDLGVYMDRIDFWWGTVEPEKGKWDWTIADKCVAYLESRGVQLYPILAYGAKWWPDRTAPQNDEEIAEYAEYVYQMVNRYKGRITYWAVWNEPNIAPFWTPQPDPDMYAKLLKAAYEAAKRADPDSKICAPVVAPLGRWDEKFIRRMYQLGCKDYFDVFDYHYYRDGAPERSVPRELAEIRALMARYGDENKPIWISEFGVSAPIENKAETYDKQASLVVRNHLVCLAEGVEKLFYFDLQNWHDRPGETWDGKLGLMESGWERKPSFTAYQTMVRVVDHKTAIGRVQGLDHGVEGALFHDEARDEYIMAMWMTDKTKRARLEVICEARDINVVKVNGETTVFAMTPPPAPGQRTRTIAVGVDWHPQYICGVDRNTYLPKAGVKFQTSLIQMSPGESRSMKLSVDERLRSSLNVKSVSAPNAITWDFATQNLRVEDNVLAGTYDLKVAMEAGEGKSAQEIMADVEIEIISPLDIVLRPVEMDGKLIARVIITNYSANAIEGELHLNQRIENESDSTVMMSRPGISLAPNTAQQIDLEIDRKLVEKYRKAATWWAKLGHSASRGISIYPIIMKKKSLQIDGDLKEWSELPAAKLQFKEQVLRGKEDWARTSASGEVKLWATPDAIFLAADVMDNNPIFNPHKANELWRGDAIELYLGLGGPAARTVIDKSIEFQIGLAPTYAGGEPVAFLFHVDRIMEKAIVAAKKTENGWALEAAIPLSELGNFEIKPGMLLGFDTAINDQDPGDWAPEANTPGRSLMWNGTGSNWIDPSGWGMAIVTE